MQNSYEVHERAGWGLSLSVAVLLFAGTLARFHSQSVLPIDPAVLRTACVVALACLGVCAVVAANCAAGIAQKALSRGPGWRRVWAPALTIVGGCAVASVLGVHLGWQILTAPDLAHMSLPPESLVLAVGCFLAFGKPAMFWVVQGAKDIDRLDEQAEDQRAVTLASIRERTADREDRNRHRIRNAAMLAAAALPTGLAAIPAVEAIQHQEALPFDAQTILDASEKATTKDFQFATTGFRPMARSQEKFNRVAELLGAGVRVADIPKMTDTPVSTVYFWAGQIMRSIPLGEVEAA